MTGRAMERLTVQHLTDVGALAAADREDLFARYPHLAHLKARILCVALCQGGALHWVDGRNGVKDLDVYTFYAASDGPRFPPRRVIQIDHTAPGLTDWQERVDIQGRSIPRAEGSDPIESVVAYLRKPRTATAWHLARKAVVLIEPAGRTGEIVWPVGARRAD